jgi:hypothetical protein
MYSTCSARLFVLDLVTQIFDQIMNLASAAYRLSVLCFFFVTLLRCCIAESDESIEIQGEVRLQSFESYCLEIHLQSSVTFEPIKHAL